MTSQHARKIKEAIDALDTATYNLSNMIAMPQPNDQAIAECGDRYVEASAALAAVCANTDVALPAQAAPGGGRMPLAPGAVPLQETVRESAQVEAPAGLQAAYGDDVPDAAKRRLDREAGRTGAAAEVGTAPVDAAPGKVDAPGQAPTSAPAR